MSDYGSGRIEKLKREHLLDSFDCGKEDLNRFLKRQGDQPSAAQGCSATCSEAADTIGARAVLVHAKDDNARGFYEHFNFEQSPSDPYHLLLIMKDLLRIVALADNR